MARGRARTTYVARAVLAKLRAMRALAYTDVVSAGEELSTGARRLSAVYEQRALVFLASAHALATLVVWAHFFYAKYRAVEKAVPIGANMYWWKRLTPPIEFGAMHAILFQMSLLPLTMARQTVAVVSQTWFARKFLPLHKVVAMHIHLGYVMVSFVFGATILFFVFFGQGCAQQVSGKEPTPGGVNTFCKKMQSEIMITGLTIMGCLLLVAITSYMRNRIKYEIFYVVHHLVFVMFALAIAHTLDDAFRAGKVRSQNFKWFSASLVWYFTDRMQAISNTRDCQVVEAHALGSDELDARKVVHLKLHRPKAFVFRVGQYVFLGVKSIDLTWHPYSIASSPHDETIDFFIEVMSSSRMDGSDSWTHKLWRDIKSGFKPIVAVNGPYGTGFNNIQDQTEVIAIGSGTGIVPMLSLAKSLVSDLIRLDARQHTLIREERMDKVRDFAENYIKEKGSLFTRIFSWRAYLSGTRGVQPERLKTLKTNWVSSHSFRDVIVYKQNSFRAEQLRKPGVNPTKMYFRRKMRRNFRAHNLDFSQLIFPLADLTAMSFLISICVNSSIATQAMREVPLWLFFVSHCYFFLHWVHSRMSTAVWYSDFVALAASTVAFAEMYDRIVDDKLGWSIMARWGYCALSLYRFARIASDVLLDGTPRARAAASYLTRTGDSSSKLQKMTLIFVTPMADFCGVIWSDLDAIHTTLTGKFGRLAEHFVDIQVHCTSKDAYENEALIAQVKDTALYKSGALHMARPNFDAIVAGPILRQEQRDTFLGEGRPSFSTSLVAFCGSTQLGATIGKAVVCARARMNAFSRNHALVFFQENYGQATPPADRGRSRLHVKVVRKTADA